MHREFERSLNCFSATVGEVSSGRCFDRYDLVELLCELRHMPVVVVGAAHVDELCGLLLNCAHNFRMTMTRGAHGDAGVAVEKDVSIYVFNPNTTRAFSYEFE